MTLNDREAIILIKDRIESLKHQGVESGLWLNKTAIDFLIIYGANSEEKIHELKYALGKSIGFTHDLLNSYINQIIQNGLVEVNNSIKNSEVLVCRNNIL